MDTILLSIGVSVDTISVIIMAYFSSYAAFTISFHSKDVLLGSGDRAALVQCTLFTFAVNSVDSLGICVLRVSSSAN